MAPAPASLKRYKAKRNFAVTPEPAEGGVESPHARQFVIQKHWATRLHYDFRIEHEGTMKSWAVPKGPSYDSHERRMAIHVEDHPISYNAFEGQIPPRQYGAGKVMIWDKGTWEPIGDPHKGYRDGNLKFVLHGYKMRGKWALVRIRGKEDKQDAWLQRGSAADAAGRIARRTGCDEAAAEKARRGPLVLRGARGRGESAGTGQARAGPGDPRRRSAEPPRRLGLRDQVRRPAGRPAIFAATRGARRAARPGGHGHRSTAGRTGSRRCPACGRCRTRSAAPGNRSCPPRSGRPPRPPGIRFSEVFDAPPRDIVTSACKIGLEGIIGKRKDSSYSSRRSPDWIKLKCSHRQEFVIGGYTDPKGSRTGLGAILVGVHDAKGNLVYAGAVGSGFNGKSLADMLQRLQHVGIDHRPFGNPTENDRRAHWVKPVLLAEVTFSEWTSDGHIRHAVFHGLRADKPAQAIVREQPVHQTGADLEQAVTHTLPPKFKVSNPERVIDPASGVTKVELVRFYGLIAPLMMEHLKGRPLSLVRAPTGITGELFFQKHLDKGEMVGIRQLDPAFWPGHEQLLEVATPRGLLSAAQMNTVEFHTWNAVKTAIGKPDRMTFDLDPGEGVGWPAVQQATELVCVFLDQLGFVSFVKTSGGKGLHVVVPIRKQYDWDMVKDFSQAIVQHLARTLPKIFVAKSGPRNRVGKIFIDYLRNGWGATTACAWSARARPGLGVSVPIAWDEIAKISGGALDGAEHSHAARQGQCAVGSLRGAGSGQGDEAARFQAVTRRADTG